MAEHGDGPIMGGAGGRRGTRDGFTIIEMAIVLAIIGLIVGLAFPGLKKLTTTGKKTEGRILGQSVVEEVVGYARLERTGGDRNLPDTLADVGVSTDVWGTPYRYYRDQDLVDDDICTMDPANIGGTYTSGGRTLTEIAFMLVSAGPNKNFQYDDGAGGGGGSDWTDHGPGDVVDDFPGDGATPDTYDDLVEAMTFYELVARVCPAAAYEDASPQAPGGYLFVWDFDDGEIVEGAFQTTGGGPPQIEASSEAVDGQLMFFDQTTSDYIVTSNSTFAVPQYTVMGWFKTAPGAVPTDYHPITSRQSSPAARNWWISLFGQPDYGLGFGNGAMAFRASSSSGGASAFDTAHSPGPLPRYVDNLWHHVAVTMRDSGIPGPDRFELQLLMDGGHVNATTNTASPATGAGYSTYVGGDHLGRTFYGYIDDVYVYDFALNATLITDYYHEVKAAGFYPNP